MKTCAALQSLQKGINVCILIYLLAVFGQFAIPEELATQNWFRTVAGLALLALAITGAFFVFQLAIRVYGTGLGILLGILTLIPLIGLFVLLAVNGKATNVLKQNGIKVSLLGANLSEI